MTKEELIAIAEALHMKAEEVQGGFYGKEEPWEDLRWEADLLEAAAILRSGDIKKLNSTHLEEIACCTGDEDANALREEIKANAHPDTDEHRAGCPHCQYVYDKALPDD